MIQVNRNLVGVALLAVALTLTLPTSVHAQFACKGKIRDAVTGACIETDTIPKKGRLYPADVPLNIQANPAPTLTQLDYSFEGPTLSEGLGIGLSGAGDFNGDGVEDFILGAPNESSLGTQTGRFSVYSGFDGSLIFTDIEPTFARAHLGEAVDAAGDVNGDGYDDIIVGEPRGYTFTQEAGFAHIYYGPDGATRSSVEGDNAGDYFGKAVAGIGDINGDGKADFAVGAYGGRYVRVFDGASLTPIYSSLVAGSGNDRFGWDIDGAGDVDNDGTPDILVGAPGFNSSTGQAHTFSGATGALLQTYNGQAPVDFFGDAVSGLGGDVNGDGHDDILVGAFIANSSAGYIQVKSGAADVNLLPTIHGSQGFENFGISVHGPGDLNGDGIPDLIAGGTNISELGVVRAYSGSNGNLMWEMDGENDVDAYGSRVASAGTRLLVAAPGNDTLAQEGGKVYIYPTQLVGMGTITPTEKLTVNGLVKIGRGGLTYPDGTVQLVSDVVGDEGPVGDPGPAGPEGPKANQGVLFLNGAEGNVSLVGSGAVSVTAGSSTVNISAATTAPPCSSGNGPVPGSSRLYSPGAECYTDYTSVGCSFGQKARRWTCQADGSWLNTFFVACQNPGPRPACN